MQAHFTVEDHDMERFASLLLDVWREGCRHIEIEESLARVAPLLARRLPFDLVLVRRIEAGRASVETVASATSHDDATPRALRNEIEAPQLESLVAWAHEGRVLHRRASALADRLPGLLPEAFDGDVIAGPLTNEDGTAGILVVAAHTPRRFDTEHVAVVQALLEPFSVALENDRRVRSLTTQQAAAEADRASLLSRLGRHDLQETIVGADGGFRPAMERVNLVAPSDVPVLILGETGSGKEVVARAIHTRSRRAHGPFLRVNCGAIPAGLIDSELFGHERGSFTGAAVQRKGWFERADGGTLFLDEIGELPLQAQVRLLRILQDGSFERVGGQRPLHVDVRIVAATHRDLHAMVADGRFREDLWYRMAVFPIQLPPLRERPEDVPALATHFALRAATRFGTPPRIPQPEDMDLLVAYAWPGNVRELAAVIDRAVILGDGRTLEVSTALGVGTTRGPIGGHTSVAEGGARSEAESAEPNEVHPARATGWQPDRSQAHAPRRSNADQEGQPFPTLDAAMRRHIEAALQLTRGRVEGRRGAAALLGINPHTLRARMRKLGIAWSRFRDE